MMKEIESLTSYDKCPNCDEFTFDINTRKCLNCGYSLKKEDNFYFEKILNQTNKTKEELVKSFIEKRINIKYDKYKSYKILLHPITRKPFQINYWFNNNKYAVVFSYQLDLHNIHEREFPESSNSEEAYQDHKILHINIQIHWIWPKAKSRYGERFLLPKSKIENLKNFIRKVIFHFHKK